ncbi:MAG: c-type cytochrome [Methylobacterium mesophilicum]|nr:c-type cytochrome [Methylobacterium mesophilicum]
MRLIAKLGLGALLLVGAGAAGGWALTAPRTLSEAELAGISSGDPAKGQRIFNAGGCASCHAAPGSDGEARLRLAGGVKLATEFGTFVAPNISPDPKDGIGSWALQDFANAVLKGVSPQGEHYYPAFPYTSYARMRPQDVADLYAYLRTLPAVQGKAAPNEVSFPFNLRRGLGLWKLLYLSPAPVIAEAESAGGAIAAGRYLVEGPGHCGECHTPRNAIGGPKKDQWLAGAAAAEGQGNVPNITGGEGGIGDWSADDIANLLETGFTPEFDSVGGSMADVIKNTSQLTAEDRAAMAAYLKAIPPHPNGYTAAPTPAQ